MCWLQPAHSGISAGRQPPSAPASPRQPPPRRPRCLPLPPGTGPTRPAAPGVAAARRRTRSWSGERPEKNQRSFKFVAAAPCEPLSAPRSARTPKPRTLGEAPGGTGQNEKRRDGNGINPRAEPPAKLQRNYCRLFFAFSYTSKIRLEITAG